MSALSLQIVHKMKHFISTFSECYTT